MHAFQFILLLGFITAAALPAAEQSFWASDAASARQHAEQNRLPLLIHFSGQNCPHCVTMERTVFSDGRVQSQLRRLGAVHLNRDVDLEYSREFNVTHVPADVIIHPDGRIEKQVGRKDKDAYLRLLNRLIAKQEFKPSRVVERPSGGMTDSRPSAATPASDTPEEQLRRSADEELFNQQTPGLQGYCPVSLIRLDQLVQGSKSHTVIRNGVRYYFASEEMRAEFLSAPRRSLPECLGCDPVLLTRELKAVPGDPRLRVRFDGKLWLFTSEKTREEFRASPLRFTSIRSALRTQGLPKIQ